MATTTPPGAVSNLNPSPAPVAPGQPQSKVDEWRKMRFIELGFNEEDANFLVHAKDTDTAKSRKGEVKRYTHPLHADRVKRLLANGMTHHDVMVIFAFV